MRVLQVGAASISVELETPPPRSVEPGRYDPFSTPGRAPWRLRLAAGGRGRREVSVSNGGPRLRCSGPGFGWSVNLERRAGAGWARRPQHLDSLLRTLWASLLPRRKGLMFHAAALSRLGAGVLAPGVSGSGKTTLSRSLSRARGLTLLTDELAMMLPSRDGWGLHPSPFWGEFRLPRGSREAPLRRIVFLARGGRSMARLTPAEAQRRLMRCLVLFEDSGDLLKRCWDRVVSLARAVPAFELAWRPDEEPGGLARRIWRKFP